MAKTVLIVVNEAKFFLSHRLPIAQKALADGYVVHVATGPSLETERIDKLGFQFHLLPISRSGKNPYVELKTLLSLYFLMKKVRPDVVHLVTIKPVLYGGIASRLAGIHGVLVAISGMGSTAIAKGFVGRTTKALIVVLYRIALGHRNLKVIFQNTQDRDIILSYGAVTSDQVIMIKGSGVSLQEYPFIPEQAGPVSVVMAARMLREKGVDEFISAARILKEKHIDVRMILVGNPDPGNPSSVSEVELKQWSQEKVIEWWGYRSDIANIFSKSHIVALPSYYGEGLPKVLIEASACGRAIVTTDHPGCRDAITDGSGILVPIKDSKKLADAIEQLIIHPEVRKQMGVVARQWAEKEFSIEGVVGAHMAAYRELST